MKCMIRSDAVTDAGDDRQVSTYHVKRWRSIMKVVDTGVSVTRGTMSPSRPPVLYLGQPAASKPSSTSLVSDRPYIALSLTVQKIQSRR